MTASVTTAAITDPAVTTTCNCATPMQENVCYSASIVMQENREIQFVESYPYSYPYLSSMSLADVTSGESTNEEQLLQVTNQGVAAFNGETASGGNDIMKQRRCKNEEDIYSYII